jgi:omega-amidase
MQDLTIALIQSDLHWESPAANRAMFEEKIWQLDRAVDVVVLPEMFTTGFTMNAKVMAEPMNLHTFKWMKQMAAHTHAAVCGSYIVQEEGRFYNRFLWMNPDGTFLHYDKKHLFRMAGEHEVYDSGEEQLIVNYKGWKLCPLVCYDLRFPVWSRNVDNAYDVLLYVANWPEARVHAWNTLLKARAIENSAYTIGVNRLGEDGLQIPYSGHSVAVDFKGEYLLNMHQEETIGYVTLSAQELAHYREKFPSWKDADHFTLHKR